MTSSVRIHTPHCCLITCSRIPQAGDKVALSSVFITLPLFGMKNLRNPCVKDKVVEDSHKSGHLF